MRLRTSSGFGHSLSRSALLVLASCAGDATPDPAVEAACAELTEAWTVGSIPSAQSCAPGPEPRDLSGSAKLAVALYHFNLQYVAGGLRGFPDGTIVDRFNLDEEQTEDRIIKEGLEPVLDLHLANPSFFADIELQALMVEVIARRHPGVLEKMRTLAARGQIELDSFHYSDQLYVAYPRRDLEVSLMLTKEVFSRVCLPRGGSIFTQEGQFARGQLPLALEHGFEAAILPKNLFKYQVGDSLAAESVLYQDPEVPEVPVLLGGESWRSPDGRFELAWTFMDDGEIAFTRNNLNPYFGLDYVLDPARIADHVQRLSDQEAAGFQHVTIREAVRAMRAQGVVPQPLPPILDGTWQPRDTNNVFRWMGGSGLFRTTESDSDTLAAIWRARTVVDRVERAIGSARSEAKEGILAAWREALLAEVSDSTGWNPFRNEIAYSREHAKGAEALAEQVLTCAGGASMANESFVCRRGQERTLAALGAELLIPARSVRTEVFTCENAGVGSVTEISLGVDKLADQEPASDPDLQSSAERDIELSFVRAGQGFELSFALEEDRAVRSILDQDYQFESIGLPLGVGLIGLGGGKYVVQDLSTGRVAAVVHRSGPLAGRVDFTDQTVTRIAASTRRYYLLESFSPEEALAFARALNF